MTNFTKTLKSSNCYTKSFDINLNTTRGKKEVKIDDLILDIDYNFRSQTMNIWLESINLKLKQHNKKILDIFQNKNDLNNLIDIANKELIYYELEIQDIKETIDRYSSYLLIIYKINSYTLT